MPGAYTRQEILTQAFARILRELVIPPPILDWLGSTLLDSDRTEQAAREQTVKRLQTKHDHIEARIETMYMDKLDGRITQEFFDRNSASCRSEQQAIVQKVRNIQIAAPLPIDQAVDVLRLTSRASELFLQQPAVEQRRFVRVVFEKAAWQYGELRTTLFEPFEILRRSNRESRRKDEENWGSGRDTEVWLPSLDTFRTYAAELAL